MYRIDSHQHFWKYNSSLHAWMNEEMDILKRDYGPHDLQPLLKSCNVEGSVAVQASQTEAENDFLLALADENDFIKGIVGWIDLRSVKVSERLSWYRQFDKIKGFRHILQDEAEDFMLHPSFLEGIRQLGKSGYTYDILIYPGHLANTKLFVKNFPDQLFVIDHLAKPSIREKQLNNWKQQLATVSAFENVYCKISGMFTEAQWRQWSPNDFKIYMDTVVELFGTRRIMYGSDWPVCTLSVSYEENFSLIKDYFSSFTQEEQSDFFGLNAKRFYDL